MKIDSSCFVVFFFIVILTCSFNKSMSLLLLRRCPPGLIYSVHTCYHTLLGVYEIGNLSACHSGQSSFEPSATFSFIVYCLALPPLFSSFNDESIFFSIKQTTLFILTPFFLQDPFHVPSKGSTRLPNLVSVEEKAIIKEVRKRKIQIKCLVQTEFVYFQYEQPIWMLLPNAPSMFQIFRYLKLCPRNNNWTTTIKTKYNHIGARRLFDYYNTYN